MTLKRKVAGGILAFSSNTLILAFLGLLGNIILVRALSIQGYGQYILILSFYSLMSLFLDFGIAGYVTTETAGAIGEKDERKAKGMLWGYSRLIIATSFMISTAVFLGSFLAEGTYERPIVDSLRACSIFLLLTGFMNIFTTTFYSHSKFRYLLLVNVTQDLLVVVFTVVFVVLLGFGVYGAILAYPVATLTALLVSLPHMLKTAAGYRNIKAGEGVFAAMMKTRGKWLVSRQLLGNFQENLTPWVIKFFLNVESVALFSVAFKVYLFFRNLISSFESTLMPITAEEIAKDWDRTNNMLNRGIKYFFWMSLPLTLLLIIASHWLITSVFTDKYAPAAPVFVILISVLLIYPFFSIYRPLFYALKKLRFWFYYSLTATVILMIYEIVGTYLLGLWGIALAYTLYFLTCTMILYFSTKRLKPEYRFMPMREVLSFDDFDRSLLDGVFKEIKQRTSHK